MLKIGLVGAGHLGKIHIELLKNIPAFSVVGFYDTDLKRSEEITSALGIPSFRNFDLLLEQCDVIDIVTPTLSHFAYAEKALRNSKHVFIEKPLTETVEQAKILTKLAKEANVKVQVGHIERFNPAFLAVRDKLKEPMLIETHRLSEYNPRGTDVSVVLDLMIHDIDIALCLIKSNIKRISCSGVVVLSDTTDIANARIEFDNGAVANLTASRISEKNIRKSRFFRKDSFITVDFLNKTASVVGNGKGVPDPLTENIEDKHSYLLNNNTLNHINVPVSNALSEELEAFANSIVSDEIPLVTIEDGLKALDVANKIIEQLRLNTNFAAVTQ